MVIKVLPVSKANNSILNGGFSIAHKPLIKKCKGNVVFMNIKAKHENKDYDLYFSTNSNNKEKNDIVVTKGILSSEEYNTLPNAYEKNRLQLTTNVSNAGATGEFVINLHNAWTKAVEADIAATVMNGDKKVPRYAYMQNKKILPMLQLKLSDSNEQNPGGDINDPIIRFSINFDKFSDKHPEAVLRGKQITTFRDYSKGTFFNEETGTEEYKLATVTNEQGEEEEIDANNIHKFITTGCIIKNARIMCNSASASEKGLSAKMVAIDVVIEPASGNAFEDVDDDDAEDEMDAIAESFKDATIAPADAAAVANANDNIAADDDEEYDEDKNVDI